MKCQLLNISQRVILFTTMNYKSLIILITVCLSDEALLYLDGVLSIAMCVNPEGYETGMHKHDQRGLH